LNKVEGPSKNLKHLGSAFNNKLGTIKTTNLNQKQLREELSGEGV
jgi:hypothetical protein